MQFVFQGGAKTPRGLTPRAQTPRGQADQGASRGASVSKGALPMSTGLARYATSQKALLSQRPAESITSTAVSQTLGNSLLPRGI